jgi:(R,R)-butanediol dehydrogenase/meso-butanediol dehydrogenase/diacetyl reductase
MLKEITMKASMSYTDDDFRETVDAFVAGKFKGVQDMITDRIQLEDVAANGFEALVKNKDDHIKILVTPKKL